MNPPLSQLVHRKVVSSEKLPHRSLWRKVFFRKERYWKEPKKILRHNRKLRRIIFGIALILMIPAILIPRLGFHTTWKTAAASGLAVLCGALFMYARHRVPFDSLVLDGTSSPFEKRPEDK